MDFTDCLYDIKTQIFTNYHKLSQITICESQRHLREKKNKSSQKPSAKVRGICGRKKTKVHKNHPRKSAESAGEKNKSLQKPSAKVCGICGRKKTKTYKNHLRKSAESVGEKNKSLQKPSAKVCGICGRKKTKAYKNHLRKSAESAGEKKQKKARKNSRPICYQSKEGLLHHHSQHFA